MKMHQTSQYTFNVTPPRFQGYFACPLKEVYMNPNSGEAFVKKDTFERPKYNQFSSVFNQLAQVVKTRMMLKTYLAESTNQILLNPKKMTVENGFLRSMWMQDSYIILPNGHLGVPEKPLASQESDKKKLQKFSESIGLPIERIPVVFEGGNTYIGKKPNGEYFIVTGRSTLSKTINYLDIQQNKWKLFRRKPPPSEEETLVHIAESFHIKPENLCILPQAAYHIDLACRPLNYPYVLVPSLEEWDSLIEKTLIDNPDLDLDVQKEIQQLSGFNEEKFNEVKESKISHRLHGLDYKTYIGKYDDMIEKLESFGLKPIKMPSPYYIRKHTAISYLNAIVHQQENGKLIYVTNASDYPELDRALGEWLVENCPQIERVHFIHGLTNEEVENGETESVFTKLIADKLGGIHCLSLEHPDFANWVV